MPAAWRAFFELLGLERLLQRRAVAIGLLQATLAIAGDEDEGQPALGEDVGDRIDRLAVDIDIEDGEVEFAGCGNALASEMVPTAAATT